MVLTIAITTLCSCSHSRSQQSAEPRTTEQSIGDLRSKDERTKITAADQLGKLREVRAIPPLVKLLKDPAAKVRIAAVEALKEIRDPSAVEPLCVVLSKDIDPRVKKMVATALARFQDRRAAESLVDALRTIPEEASDALVSMGDIAVEPLVENLHRPEIGESSIDALTRIGPPAVEALIREARTSTYSYGRIAALQALSEIQDPRAVDAVNFALKAEDNPKLAAMLYRFLIRNGRPESEPLLQQALTTYGNIGMAADFLGCGNPKLKAYAERWLVRSHNKVVDQPAQAKLIWGKIPEPADVQLSLFHYDNSLLSGSHVAPVLSTKTSFVAGKFGMAVAVAPDGVLSYPMEGNLDLANGTIEMWIAPRFDGDNAIYRQFNHSLLLYVAPNQDHFIFAATTAGAFYAGSVVDHKFTGVGGGTNSAWKAGDWHHMAFSYSARYDRQRIYVDGELISEARSKMPLPAVVSGTFTVDSDPWGHGSAFAVDELRISKNEKSSEAIGADANRMKPFSDEEVKRVSDHPGTTIAVGLIESARSAPR